MNQNILMQLLEDPTSSEDTRDRYPTCCFYARDYIIYRHWAVGRPSCAKILREMEVNILVTGNLDSGILETDIPEEGNSLIGLFTTYQVVRYCQAQSRFAVL